MNEKNKKCRSTTLCMISADQKVVRHIHFDVIYKQDVQKINEMEYENRIVAFIDILGFKSLIESSEKDIATLATIMKALEFLKGKEKSKEWNLDLIEIEESAQLKFTETFDISQKMNCICFSDSIVVSIIANSNEEINKAFSTLVTNIALMGSILAETGVWIRGAISYGKLIHRKDGTIFGQALIDAYNLETQNAIYPRIIISDKLLGKLNYPLRMKKHRYPYHQYISRFDDGCVGFSQLRFFRVVEMAINEPRTEMIAKLEKIRIQIVRGLDTTFENRGLFQKYKWLKMEYNETIRLMETSIKKINNLYEEVIGEANIEYKYFNSID